jgi:hypothetical protein
MLAIDGPISLIAGLALADAGRKTLETRDRGRVNSLRRTVLLYSAFFITPIPFYFFMGWPAWEVNYLWQWQDDLLDSPLRAAVAFAIFLFTVGPAFLGFEFGYFLIRRGKPLGVRLAYILLLVLVGIIVIATRDITFHIASTYAKFQAGEFYSFWSFPFFLGWLLVTAYFWGSLVVFYVWLRKRAAG